MKSDRVKIRKIKSIFFGNLSIWIYFGLYTGIAFTKFLFIFKINLVESAIVALFFGWILYLGLKGIQTGKLWGRGFPLGNGVSRIAGLLLVIFSLYFLIFL